MRKLDDALGLSDLASAALCDTRRGKNTIHRLDGLFRQSVFGRLAGYEDVNDAAQLALDPVMRQVVGGRAVDVQAASASQVGRFETETLALPDNRAALADLNGRWIDRFHDRNGLKYIVLDMDSSVSPTHGDQEGAAWNGHFDCTCYHPNFLFNQFGMLERCALRHGNVHSADGWRDVLDPVIARYAERDIMRFFRADAAYAIPAIYERLEEAKYFYAIRLRANTVLREKIAHRLTRPVGRPSQTKVKRFYEDFEYQAASWDKERRVIAKIEWQAILTSECRPLGECRMKCPKMTINGPVQTWSTLMMRFPLFLGLSCLLATAGCRDEQPPLVFTPSLPAGTLWSSCMGAEDKSRQFKVAVTSDEPLTIGILPVLSLNTVGPSLFACQPEGGVFEDYGPCVLQDAVENVRTHSFPGTLREAVTEAQIEIDLSPNIVSLNDSMYCITLINTSENSTEIELTVHIN